LQPGVSFLREPQLSFDRKTIETKTIQTWLRRRAEDIGVVMIAVMFIAFIVQIVFRYLLNFPIGWTSELTIIMWLWLVLWGASFMVREREEIRFDLIYSAVGKRTRNVMVVVGALALIGAYVFSFPAVADYVTFMKVQKTAYLKIRFDWLFSIYLLFVVAIVARYLWILWDLFRGKEAEEFDPTDAGSGV
jgi:TRAP-type C4-dicarboxylate transport system permease small subunit